MKKSLLDFLELLKNNNLIVEYDIPEDILNRSVDYISYNSIDVIEGTLFICKGLNFREQYLDDAIEKGAFCYIAEKVIKEDFPYILVKDMRNVISDIGSLFYDEIWNDKLQMIGITGTKGKSTTATFVKAIMDEYCASIGEKPIGFLSGIYTYDGRNKQRSKMTTPETLQLHSHLASCVNNGLKYLVMETSSQALKYERTKALKYKVGAFLNFSEDHISDIEHPNLDDYLDSKLRIFGQCETGCVNFDLEEELLQRILSTASEKCNKVVTFGTKEGADYYGFNIESTPGQLKFKVQCEGKIEDIVVSIGGYYNASNALASIAMTRSLGVPFEYIKEGLSKVKVAGRMELYQLPNKHVDVIIDYAHNKLSYETLFDSVKKLYPDRKIMLIFGCVGNKAYNRRKELGEFANKNADKIILTEKDPGTESVTDICNQIKSYMDNDKPVSIIEDRGKAIDAACDMIEENWVLVIAGNGADWYQKRGSKYVELPTDGERVQEYISAHQ